MEPDQITQALQPFEQLDTGYARMHEGTGLGLSLVQRYLDLHGGELSISSEPDRGTVVTILFPAPSIMAAAGRS